MLKAVGPVPASHDDIVMVPVPRPYYGTVIQALAAAMSSDAVTPSESSDAPMQGATGKSTDRVWTRQDVTRLNQIAQNPSIRAIFALSVERGGELVSIREVEEATGRKHAQVRADLGGLTKMCNKTFGRTNWPFNAVWAANGKEEMSYWVPADVLRWWQGGE